MPEYVLCPLADLIDGQSKGITVQPDSRYADLLLVRKAAKIYAYRNRCPHTGAPMEWEPDQFLDYTNTLIQCGIHGALFRIEDGYCISGPCTRQSLEHIPVVERDGWLIALASPERQRG